MKIRTKHKIKEIIVLSTIIFVLGLLIKFNSYHFKGFLARLFFPQNNTLFEFLKIYFTSVSIVLMVEYFLVVQLPNNFFLSRATSLLIMIILFIISFGLYITLNIKINIQLYLLFSYIVNIVIGQLLSYFIQSRQLIKNGKYIAIFIYVFLIIFIVVFSLFKSINLLSYNI